MTTNARPERIGTGDVVDMPGRQSQASGPGDQHAAVVRASQVVDGPIAEVVEIKPHRDSRVTKVRCPYGDHQYVHGLGYSNQDRVQYRTAHCHGGDYAFVVPEWAAELVRPGSARRGRA